MHKLLILLILFMVGCVSTSKLKTISPIAENNKDVLILSTLIRNHLTQTNGSVPSLAELIKSDTLKRISNNFEEVKLRMHGGFVSMNFKFSSIRNADKIELTDKEKDMLTWHIWAEKQLNEPPYDGYIQFSFGERHYNIRKIIIRK